MKQLTVDVEGPKPHLNPAADALSALLGGKPVEGEQFAQLFGFGGLHGGVVAALLLNAMVGAVELAQRPIEMTVHFGAATRARPDVVPTVVRAGRRSSLIRADAVVAGRSAATATATFARAESPALGAVVAPRLPDGLTPLADAAVVTIPAEFVPIFGAMELRAATDALPFSGSSAPELTAWIRLRSEVADPLQRLLVLVDGLAPSYSAILTLPVAIPTVRLTVRFSPAALSATSEWVLIRARTSEAADDGWLSETIDLWTVDGEHLVSATQLRTSR